jgi:DNA mismatch repair protein MSH6
METIIPFQLTFLFKLVEGVAKSSFGTHVANLAGVPLDVVERADVVSKDFAKQFKQRMADKKEKSASARLPLVALADFAYLYGLATGVVKLPEDPLRQREVVARLKECVRRNVEK